MHKDFCHVLKKHLVKDFRLKFVNILLKILVKQLVKVYILELFTIDIIKVYQKLLFLVTFILILIYFEKCRVIDLWRKTSAYFKQTSEFKTIISFLISYWKKICKSGMHIGKNNCFLHFILHGREKITHINIEICINPFNFLWCIQMLIVLYKSYLIYD